MTGVLSSGSAREPLKVYGRGVILKILIALKKKKKKELVKMVYLFLSLLSLSLKSFVFVAFLG